MTTTASPSTCLLFVNPGSGADNDLAALLEAARPLGLTIVELDGDFAAVVADAFAAHGDDLAAAGIAGGDGSLALVAQHCIDRDVPFVCIPFGTRNHFARDLGLDRDDPIAALASFSERAEHRIDIGCAGDRLFLNNVTFGIYAEVVDDDAYRDAKLRTSLRVTREILRGDRAPDSLEIENETGEVIDSPFATLISNNCYETMNARDLGVRRRLDEGVLQVWVLEAERMSDLASVAHAALSSRLDPEDHPNVEAWTTDRLPIESDEPEIAAGVDGESVTLPMPLEVVIRPAALRVWVPHVVKRADE